MAWLEQLFGPDLPAGVQYGIMAVVAIITLLVIIWLFRLIFGRAKARMNKNRLPRLSVTDAAAVDDKRRLVLVRRDNVEHLVMIGGPSDIVIEQNIVRTAPVASAQPAAHQAQQTAQSNSPAPVTPPVTEKPDVKQESAGSRATPTAAAATGAAASNSKLSPEAVEPVIDTSGSISGTVSDISQNITNGATDAAKTVSSSITGLGESASARTSQAAQMTSDTTSDLASALGIEAETNNDVAPSPAAASGDAPPVEATPEPAVSPDSAVNKTEDEMEQLLKQLGEERK